MSWPLSRYLERLHGLGLAPATVKQTRASLHRFLRFCSRALAEVTPSELAAYRDHLEETPTVSGGWRAPATVAGELLKVRSFLRWAHSVGLVLVDPSRHLVIKRPPQPLPRLLTVDQVERLLAVPSPATLLGRRDRALVETLYGLGLRAGECCALDLVDLAWNPGRVRVRPGKNRRARALPLGDQLARVLADYLDKTRPALARRSGEPALFLSMLGRRLSQPRLQQVIRAAAEELGLRASCHSLRRACATHLLLGGAQLPQVQAWLGHQDIRSTQAYTHLQPLEVFAEHQRTHPRARRKPL